jgi:hypothetical protein
MSLYRTDIDPSKPSFMMRSGLLKRPDQTARLTDYAAFRLWSLITKYPEAYLPKDAHDDHAPTPSSKPTARVGAARRLGEFSHPALLSPDIHDSHRKRNAHKPQHVNEDMSCFRRQCADIAWIS